MKRFDICSFHSGNAAVEGPPKGNLYWLKHGFYARPEAVGYVPEAGTRGSIDGEIALLAAHCVALERWLTEKVAAGEDVDVPKYAGMILRTTWKIIRMRRLREVIGADSDPISELFDGLPGDEGEKPLPEA